MKFTNTDDGAAALLAHQLAAIEADGALGESSRAQRVRETKNIIAAAREHLAAGEEHGVHEWFAPGVLRSMQRPKAMDTLGTVAGKCIEYAHPPPDDDADDTRAEGVLRALTELALLKERRTKGRRASKAETPPPPLAQFREPALALAGRMLAADGEMHGVDVCVVLMVLLVTVRVNGLRDLLWGDNVKQVAASAAAYMIQLGTSRGGKKSKKLFAVATTDEALALLDKAGILSPALAVQLLAKWEAQCGTTDSGMLVFAPRFGCNTIGTRFKELTGSTPGELRRRVAWDAARLVHDGTLPESVTAYLCQNMQHDPATHVHDYEGGDTGSEAEASADSGSEGAASDDEAPPPAPRPQPAARRAEPATVQPAASAEPALTAPGALVAELLEQTARSVDPPPALLARLHAATLCARLKRSAAGEDERALVDGATELLRECKRVRRE